MAGNRLLPARAVADLLGVCLKTLHNWDDSGILRPDTRIRGRRYYCEDAVEALITGEGRSPLKGPKNQLDTS